MPDLTHSQFSRLDERARQVEPIARQVARVEEKVDGLHKALANLVVFEERQAAQAARFRELVDTVGANRAQHEARVAAMAERFDSRVTALEKAQGAIGAELHGYVQRWMGVSFALGLIGTVGGAWSVLSKLMH